MAALTGDINISEVGPVVTVPLSANAADVYYKGAVVYIDTAGGAQVTFGTADRPIGISPKQQNPAIGDEVQVIVWGVMWVPAITGVAALDEGERLVGTGAMTDNIDDYDSGSGVTVAANDICLGRILRFTTTRTLIFVNGGLAGSVAIGTAGTWE